MVGVVVVAEAISHFASLVEAISHVSFLVEAISHVVVGISLVVAVSPASSLVETISPSLVVAAHWPQLHEIVCSQRLALNCLYPERCASAAQQVPRKDRYLCLSVAVGHVLAHQSFQFREKICRHHQTSRCPWI